MSPFPSIERVEWKGVDLSPAYHPPDSFSSASHVESRSKKAPNAFGPGLVYLG